MKKNILFVAFLVCLFNLSLMGQARIAVIPFTGLSASEGNLLANMTGAELRKVGGYQIAPRTSAINAAIKEQNIQRTGLTDSETISELGKGANAQFVVSGHVQKLGNRNLVSVSIIDVETHQQISGDYVEYGVINEVVNYLPTLAKILLSRMNTDYRSLPTLAIIPFMAEDEASVNDRDVLAQILAIEIANSGKYAVVTRTTSLESVMKEHNIQRSGLIDEATILELGVAINADYVLSGDITKLDDTGYISASVINVEKKTLEVGSYMDYKTLGDGIRIVPKLSFELTGLAKEALLKLPTLLEEYKGRNDISTIKALLARGINEGDGGEYGGKTALYIASENGYTEIAVALIQAGADIDIENDNGRTALYITSSGYTEIALALIAAGANVNIPLRYRGETPLMLASIFGNTELVIALIAAGADVNVKDYDDTALNKAYERGHWDIVKLLETAGAVYGYEIE